VRSERCPFSFDSLLQIEQSSLWYSLRMVACTKRPSQVVVRWWLHVRSNHLAQVYDASSNRNKYNKPLYTCEARWFLPSQSTYLTMRCFLLIECECACGVGI
jgi:hypothetical protein